MASTPFLCSIQATNIYRISDGLPLASSVDDEQTENALTEHKQQAKLIVRRLSPNSEPVCSIESGAYTLHYLILCSVIYLVITEKSYPRKLAFAYLDECAKEFQKVYGDKVDNTTRPYAFVGFDSFMSKTARTYRDSRSASLSSSSAATTPSSAAALGAGAGQTGNLTRINDELQDVTRIMSKNMEDLLWRGDSLDRMSTLSTSLRSESMKYRKQARNINLELLIRQYAPVGFVGLFIVIFVWWRFF
ncbi:protein transport protein sec22 [Phaffia rhodozyma]|uniref:Protein transport protein SEC22 n=1 Tax=Phaffia rhodozyma TaxID=264483 RepID=A0A0F7SJ78_PHARH|nr:protein transport protein sec22 [Phaffia rhodozyma]